MPVSDDLTLDISSALSQVDELGAAIDARLAEASAGLASGLADALAEPLAPTIDTATVSDELGAALADATAVPLEVVADEATLGGSIDEALNAVNAIVPVDGDVAPLEAAVTEAAAGTTATVQVEADTSGAEASISGLQDQIDALGASATESAGQGGGDTGLGGLEKGATGVGTAAALASGETAGLTESASALGPQAAVAAGSLAAVAGVTADFTKEAISAQSASLRLTNTFGDAADSVRQVNVGNLNTDLATLGKELGTTQADLEASAAKLGVFAQAGGASAEQAATFTNNVQALAARAVALNPSLGNVADVSDRLSTALSRGGRFASNYGLSLTAAQIANEALAETGKSSADQLTIQEKSAAGATLALQKYGDTLDQTIAQGSQNPIIQLEALKTQLTEVAAQLGQPLVSPVFDLLRAAQPIFIDVATVFGRIAQVLVPVATTIIDALVPAFDQLTPAILQAISAAGPGLTDAALSLGQALQNMLPAIVELTPTIIGLGASLGVLAQELAEPVRLFSLLVPGLVKAAQVLTPFLGLLTLAGSSSQQAAEGASAYNLALFGQAATTEDTKGKLEDLNASAAKYISTSSDFAKTGQSAALLKVGESAEVLNTQLNNGTKGIEQFTAAAITAGQVKLKIDGVDQSADDVGKLNGQLTGLLANGRAQLTQGEQLVGTFANENQKREQAAQQQLEILVSGGQITQQQRDEAVARSLATNGLGSYVQALSIAVGLQNVATDSSKSATDELEARAIAQQKQSDGLALLATQAANAGVSADDLKKKSTELGLEQDKLKAFTDGVSKAFEDFRNSLVSNLPGIDQVLQKVGDDLTQGTNPQKLIDQLNASTEALVEFQANVQFLIDNNFTALATIAAQRGPDFTNALVQSIKVGRAGLGAELNNNVQVYVDNLNKTKDFLTQTAAPQLFDINTAAGQEATKAFGGALDYSGQTTLAVTKVPGAIQAGQPNTNKAASTAGAQTTDAFGQTLLPGDQVDSQFADAQGKIQQLGLSGAPLLNFAGGAGSKVALAFGAGIAIIFQAYADGGTVTDVGKSAVALVDMIDRVVRAEAGIHSPSTLAQGWGSDIGAGLAQGIIEASPQVTAAATKTLDGLTEVFSQRRNDGTLETVFNFGDGSEIISGTEGLTQAAKSLTGASGEAGTAITQQRDALLSYTTAAQDAAAATSGLAAAQAGVRGPNDGLFGGGSTAQPTASLASTLGSGAASSSALTFNLTVEVQLAPGVTVGDGVEIGRQVAAQVSPTVQQMLATVKRS